MPCLSQFYSPISWSSGGAAALVDLNGDGVLDIPVLDSISPLPTYVLTIPPSQSLYLRVLGRSGLQNQFGATVCLLSSSTQAVINCRVIDAGGGSNAQTPYDVHFGILSSLSASGVDVAVTFVNGHVHNRTTSASCSGVAIPPRPVAPTIIVADVPSIVSLSMTPTAGVMGIGRTVLLTLMLRWGEAGLAPWLPRCCVVNQVNVSSSFVSKGAGVYTVTYVVAEGDGDVVNSAPNVTLAVVDPRYPSTPSDVVTAARLPGSFGTFVVDAVRPQINFTCVSWNNTARPTNMETVCVSCGLQSNESLRGCSVYYTVVGSGVVTLATPVTPTSTVVNITSQDGDNRVGGVVICSGAWCCLRCDRESCPWRPPSITGSRTRGVRDADTSANCVALPPGRRVLERGRSRKRRWQRNADLVRRLVVSSSSVACRAAQSHQVQRPRPGVRLHQGRLPLRIQLRRRPDAAVVAQQCDNQQRHRTPERRHASDVDDTGGVDVNHGRHLLACAGR